MLKLAFAALIAIATPAAAQAQSLFGETGSWRVFKNKDSCIAFSDSGYDKISIYWARNPDMVILTFHAIGSPSPILLGGNSGMMRVKMGEADWGQMQVKILPENSSGLHGAEIVRQGAKALDDVANALSVTFTYFNQVDTRVTMYGRDVADMLRRCVG